MLVCFNAKVPCAYDRRMFEVYYGYNADFDASLLEPYVKQWQELSKGKQHIEEVYDCLYDVFLKTEFILHDISLDAERYFTAES